MTIIPNLSSYLLKLLYKRKQLCGKHYSTAKSYKLLFFGSNSTALSSLHKIVDLRKKETHLINRLDLVTANSKHSIDILKYAEVNKIKTIQWPLQELRAEEYDLGIIVGFGHLIKKDLLSKFPLGIVNVHPSLLPRWRGAAPVVYTLLHGDQFAGVTLMRIKADIFDVGEIISQVKVPISNDIRYPELTKMLFDIGNDMLVDCIRTLPSSLQNAQPQSTEGVTYAKKISKSISKVNWSQMTAIEVYNLYRALYGLFTLTTTFRDNETKLFDAFIHNSDEVENTNKLVGTIEYCASTDAIRILCKDRRYIYFKSMRIVGRRQISAYDFYNGYIKNVPVDKKECTVFRNQ